MRTFLNHIKNETLEEIKTSLETLWQRMIQLSEFFQYSFVLILKRKCLVGASRVRRGESGTPSTIIYTRWSNRRYELGCDAPVVSIERYCFTRLRIPLLKINRHDRLIFNMGIPTPRNDGLHTETRPSLLKMLETEVCKFYFYKHGILIRHIMIMMTSW